MRFLERDAAASLVLFLQIGAVEGGSAESRERWQRTQLQNLLRHASERSSFWRQRLGAEQIEDAPLSSLPVLTRSEVREQVEKEGSLLTLDDGIATAINTTSGSSGTPAQFYTSQMNQTYYGIRSGAQFLFEGLDLTQPRTQLKLNSFLSPGAIKVAVDDSWMGQLSEHVACGKYRVIDYHPQIGRNLVDELLEGEIGYLVAPPWTLDVVLQHVSIDRLKTAGLRLWMAFGGNVDIELRSKFDSVGIPIRANYSSEEFGIIAVECSLNPDHYHVATSNVIVEVVKDGIDLVENDEAGFILVTHLHSYATPFVRYDIGDVGQLWTKCRCGHNGPTLSQIFGRQKQLLSHPDGKLSHFQIRAAAITGIVKCDEFRIRQTALDTLVVEIGGRQALDHKEVADLRAFLKRYAGERFDIEIHPVAEIDWGSSRKRLGFRNELL